MLPPLLRKLVLPTLAATALLARTPMVVLPSLVLVFLAIRVLCAKPTSTSVPLILVKTAAFAMMVSMVLPALASTATPELCVRPLPLLLLVLPTLARMAVLAMFLAVRSLAPALLVIRVLCAKPTTTIALPTLARTAVPV
jgi:hypothetical protein